MFSEIGSQVYFPGNSHRDTLDLGDLGHVSRNSRNFTGHFRVSQFPLYLKNGKDLSRQTSQ